MKSLGLVKNLTNTKRLNYNAKGEVVTANHSTNNAFDRSYEFDGIGNRKKSSDSLTLPTTDNYQANALNQYGSIDGNTRSFDEDGNLTSDGTKQYVWDAENRLIAVKQGSNTIAEYAYDYQSRRISKTVGSEVKSFVYDGWNPIALFAGTTLDKTYTWGTDLSGTTQGAGGVGGLLSVNDGSQNYYPTFDGNGNVSEYVNATGAVVAHYEYDAFGQVVASGTKANDFVHQFSTKQLDSESGLHYYGYRYYDSSNGRWLGRDPVGEIGFIRWFNYVEEIRKQEHKLEVKFVDDLVALNYFGGGDFYKNHIESSFYDDLERVQGAYYTYSENLGGENLYGFVQNGSVNFIDVLGMKNWCCYYFCFIDGERKNESVVYIGDIGTDDAAKVGEKCKGASTGSKFRLAATVSGKSDCTISVFK